MALDIGSALKQGAQRTFKKNGLIIAALLFLGTLLNTVFSNSLIEALGGLSSVPGGATSQVGLSLGLSVPVAGLLLVITAIASAIVSITAVRTFVSSETNSIPKEFYTRNIPLALVNLFVGGIIYGLAVGIGFIAFVIPGIFLAISLYFWNVYVIVEDQNFIDGFKNSWELTEGSRLQLFGLAVLIFVIQFAVGFGAGIIMFAVGQTIGQVIQLIATGFMSAFSVATAAQAYNQLTE